MDTGLSILNLFFALLALLPFYLIGAYPTGFLIARKRGLDIRDVGSGNTGATNVARFLGFKAGAWTAAGDVTKGVLSMTAANLLWADQRMVAAAAVATVAGHCFSIPKRLRGGKGVATGLGVLLVLQPAAALCAVAIFAATLAVWHIVSVASLAAAFAAPLFGLLWGAQGSTTSAAMLIFIIVLFRHRSNLNRLWIGTEQKFSFRSKSGRT